MDEQWRDIEGYDGMYQISSCGRVKSKQFGKEKILKPRIEGGGYFQVSLRKEGEVKQPRVSRLVANAFLPNSENKSEVDHIDRVRTNNHVTNLRWVTSSENNLNRCVFNPTGYRGVEKRSNGRFRARIQIDGAVVYIGTFDTVEEASDAHEAVWTGLNH